MIYPEKEEFLKLSEKYEKITIYKEIFADTLTPVNLLLLLSYCKNLFLLESTKIDKTFSRFSFLGSNPEKVLIGTRDHVIIQKGEDYKKINKNIIDYINENYQEKSQFINEEFGDFAGGLVGFFGYETVNFMNFLRKKIKISDEIHSIVFEVNKFFVFDNFKNKLYAAICVDNNVNYFLALEKLDDFTKKVFKNKKNSSTSHLPPSTLTIEKEYQDIKFLDKINSIKDEIINGEAIQVVLSRKYTVYGKVNPFSFYRALRNINPSPYMFFIKFNDKVLAGSSPETHLKVKNRYALLKPIAGTYPVGKDLEKIKKALLDDEKEISEHLMLLDLARNDLYQGCDINSVKVTTAFSTEVYSHVIHIVSEVIGRLKNNVTPFQLFLKTFPAGTVSGAPKVRAIELISEYEESTRGFYSGCVGYINYNHSLDTCITIRSAFFEKEKTISRAGAGIVADSSPENELKEIDRKLKAIFSAINFITQMEKNNVFAYW